MAQLRHAQTSALIAEGTPLDLALITETVGGDRVIYDDVGEHFDARLVLAAHHETLDGLTSAAKAAPAGSDERLDLDAALTRNTPDVTDLVADVGKRLALADVGNVDLAQA